MKSRIAACVALLCLTLGFSPLFGDENQDSPNRLTDALILRKAKLQQNAEFSVKQYVVDLDPEEVSEVRNALNANAFQSKPISSLANAKAGADEVIARVLKAARTPNPSPVFWDIKLYNGMSKFAESCDEPALPAKPGVNIVTENGNQYLITAASIYQYRPSQNVLNVRPLDPMADAYPVSLDVLAFEFNLIGSGARAFSGMPVVKTGDSYRAERADNSQIYLFRDSKEGLISEYFFTNGKHTNFVENTFGNYFDLPYKAPLAFPSIGASIHVSAAGTGVLQLLAVTEASQGKLTSADMPISISKGTNIRDTSINYSSAMDPALITHP